MALTTAATTAEAQAALEAQRIAQEEALAQVLAQQRTQGAGSGGYASKSTATTFDKKEQDPELNRELETLDIQRHMLATGEQASQEILNASLEVLAAQQQLTRQKVERSQQDAETVVNAKLLALEDQQRVAETFESRRQDTDRVLDVTLASLGTLHDQTHEAYKAYRGYEADGTKMNFFKQLFTAGSRRRAYNEQYNQYQAAIQRAGTLQTLEEQLQGNETRNLQRTSAAEIQYWRQQKDYHVAAATEDIQSKAYVDAQNNLAAAHGLSHQQFQEIDAQVKATTASVQVRAALLQSRIETEKLGMMERQLKTRDAFAEAVATAVTVTNSNYGTEVLDIKRIKALALDGGPQVVLQYLEQVDPSIRNNLMSNLFVQSGSIRQQLATGQPMSAIRMRVENAGGAASADPETREYARLFESALGTSEAQQQVQAHVVNVLGTKAGAKRKDGSTAPPEVIMDYQQIQERAATDRVFAEKLDAEIRKAESNVIDAALKDRSAVAKQAFAGTNTPQGAVAALSRDEFFAKPSVAGLPESVQKDLFTAYQSVQELRTGRVETPEQYTKSVATMLDNFRTARRTRITNAPEFPTPQLKQQLQAEANQVAQAVASIAADTIHTLSIQNSPLVKLGIQTPVSDIGTTVIKKGTTFLPQRELNVADPLSVFRYLLLTDIELPQQ